ncbi:cytochrome oxidase subunit, putative (mitochondrion) [Theileria equi strain WA]|uniref:Cytochrome c oxidase subunit 1 n=2 Tax=Theileria TaxID=5873 RepID=L1L9X6_THEEQ|nr:cytochrome oxidase subunit, putative [Theileria equi strain WA]EKX71953.1 cytochrome oxidase subunit, putative [Theileria equi strain WA]|eukprot:XP_025033546.1 cytochrome oxidase subunit, putative (mitochondrion) [Theileria equi strain WA]
MSVAIRTELSMSGLKIISGDTLEIYNVLFTLHGIIMVFFNVMTGLLGGIGNYLYPIFLGASDVVFPRSNLYSLLMQPVSYFFVLSSIYLEIGSGTGWTLYPPLSTSLSQLGIDMIILGLVLSGISSILGSVNFITTFFSLKLVGSKIELQLPVSWSILLTSILLLLSLPFVTTALIMVYTDRHHNTMFFDQLNSGDPVIYQHLFWLFGHPEVYVMILPAFGIISIIMSIHAKKEVFGNQTMILAMLSIGVLGSLVWGHHMYTSGMEIDSRSYFTTLTILISLPTGNKIFNWVCTSKSFNSIRTSGILLLTSSFILMFVIGGTTGVVLGNSGVDISLHDTMYVVGHFHFVLSIGAIIGLLSFLVFSQRLFLKTILSNKLIIFIIPVFLFSVLLTFTPMHFVGFSPLPRRIPDYPDEMWGWNLLCTIGSTMTLVFKIILILVLSF